ncbi:MAG: sigma-70 family RNA polymerase sigma factor [Pseudomonadales bacterium]|nr:sigma-70 family RNA polymerase sigma factor [Pseudomonadales bacterium]MCP5183579.1 sigma-70 family RNA polymerase sigma factor [Pseudomonadales bacterium]
MSRKSAFGVLYTDYYRRVYGLCRRLLGAGQLAEDATQETFMRAYRSFHKFEPTQPFWQWIAAIASNHCVDLLRGRHRDAQLFGQEQAELDVADDTQLPILTHLENTEAADRLNALVAELPDRYRIPLVLAYYQGISYDDIASQLGITRTHVGVLLLRAKEKLRGALIATPEAGK